MKTFKKISYLVFLFCVLQWPSWKVETASVATSTKTALTEGKGQDGSSSILGSIYHKSRQSRCVTCYEDRRYGSEDRNRYASYSSRSGDDRSSSWYYPNYDRYEDRGYRGSGSGGGDYDRYAAPGADRYRYGADRYGADRYGGAESDRYGSDRYGAGADRYGGYRDDRYGARPAYDRYDTRTRGSYDKYAGYDRGESRGYGYDNRGGGAYASSERDRYYERPRYGSSGGAGGYDRDNYDRYSPRYDYGNYRPWDEKYSGKSDYDSYSRGHYTSNAGSQEDRRYLPEPGYNSPAISPCGVQKPNCPYAPQEGGTRVTSGPIGSGYHNMGVSQTTYNTNSNSNQDDSSKGSGNGWSYMREDEQSRGGNTSGSNSSSNNNNNNNNNSNSNSSNRDRNRDQSPAYGALLDRGSNLIAVEPVKANESANDSMTNNGGDQQQSGGVENGNKQSDNGQNS